MLGRDPGWCRDELQPILDFLAAAVFRRRRLLRHASGRVGWAAHADVEVIIVQPHRAHFVQPVAVGAHHRVANARAAQLAAIKGQLILLRYVERYLEECDAALDELDEE